MLVLGSGCSDCGITITPTWFWCDFSTSAVRPTLGFDGTAAGRVVFGSSAVAPTSMDSFGTCGVITRGTATLD